VGKAQIRVVEGPNRGIVLDLPLGRRVVIGRGDDVDLHLSDANISPRHCALEYRLSGVFVEDLQSSTGTVLDGRSLNGRGCMAPDSASLLLGGSRLQIFLNHPEESPPQIPGVSISRRLGAGASGTVWEGVIRSSRQPVAIKFLDPNADPITRERFEREASLKDRLKHPGIAEIHSLLVVNGRPCLVRELVAGRSLEQHVEEDGALDWAEAFAIGIMIAQALSHAHSHGVVHRDVKPENIVMDQQRRQPKLIDFDLAKRLPGATHPGLTRLTETGEGLGSLAYLAPEQLTAARDVGAVADIYGLGMTLYHLITGSRPFRDVEPEDFITALNETGPRALGDVVPSLPTEAREALERAYDPDPAKRYADARSFAMALSYAASS
jgi:serine/threonine-protein kinase